MFDTLVQRDSAASIVPARLHHAAYVSADQERTRRFYEDVLGFPLVAFLIEREQMFDDVLEFSHAFYGLADGSSLAFFNFANPEQQVRFAAQKQSPFIHLALKVDRTQQSTIRARLEQAGFAAHEVDHGFCKSLYVSDPDGQLIEFTADVDDIDRIEAHQRSIAHESLQRWLEGDRTTSNE